MNFRIQDVFTRDFWAGVWNRQELSEHVVKAYLLDDDPNRRIASLVYHLGRSTSKYSWALRASGGMIEAAKRWQVKANRDGARFASDAFANLTVEQALAGIPVELAILGMPVILPEVLDIAALQAPIMPGFAGLALEPHLHIRMETRRHNRDLKFAVPLGYQRVSFTREDSTHTATVVVGDAVVDLPPGKQLDVVFQDGTFHVDTFMEATL